jgi:hypothetical protein
LSGITADTVATLTEQEIDVLLSAGMSIAVYDTAANRIDHVWARSDSGEASFTRYHYDADGALVYTVTGSNRVDVDGISGVDLTNVAILSEAQIDTILASGMSLAVYDRDENRVDHVWSRDGSGEISFTQYHYDSLGKLVYTVSGALRSEVEGLSSVTTDTVGTLTEVEINDRLVAGMSIAVYDTVNNRIDHVWSMSDAGQINFTKYFYTTVGELAYTVTGANRSDVEGLTGIDVDAVTTLSAVEIETILQSGMSVAVYDVSENRIMHVWSRDENGDITFTEYNYDSLGKLVYTVSADTRMAVEGLDGITVEQVALLSESDIDSYLSAGMSIAVYDTVNNRVDHVWSRGDNGEASFTKYYYDMTGKLVYTVTGSTRGGVENITDITIANAATLTEEQIATSLGAGMSMAIYDTVNNRVDHVWSRDAHGAVTFTQYTYDGQGKLVYTISGEIRADVMNVTGITAENFSGLSESEIDSILGYNMSIAIYDTINNRVDTVWAKNETGQLSYTQYFYNEIGKLVYTVSGATQADVDSLSGVTTATVSTLSEAEIRSLLLNGMSIAVYAAEDNRIDHVWSRSDTGEIAFTQYHYDSLGKLVYTVSAENRTRVEGLTGLTVDTVASLTQTDITDLLASGMSVSVYDTINNRVDHVWSRADDGSVSFTKYYYHYDATGALVYTVSGSSRSSVEGLSGITVDNVRTLTADEVDLLLGAGMSIAVYEQARNRVDHVWARSDNGNLTFTQYSYDSSGRLVYTLTGADKNEVEAISGVTIDTVATLSETDIQTILSPGMSIAVYDSDYSRVDYVWSTDDIGAVGYTKYYYNELGKLVYTITGDSRAQVDGITGVTIDTAASLTQTQISTLLSSGMSIAVYDTANNRVDHVWSRDDSGAITFTRYYYNSAQQLAYTITGGTRTEVENISGITLSNVAVLTAADIDSLLGAGMSVAIYDTDNNRVDHVWSRSDIGENVFTKYHYDSFGRLVYTVSADKRDVVENLEGITVDTVMILTETEIDSLLSAGMSIAVYDTAHNRVDHVWSRSEAGAASFAKYFYDDSGDLAYTITGASRSVVEGLDDISVTNVMDLTQTYVDSLLSSGMSIAVYDRDTNRVDHVWARSDDGSLSFTKYFYTDDSLLSYTISGVNRQDVETITGISQETVDALTAIDIDAMFTNGMSIAVYDTTENRVDYIWSKNESGDVAYTDYYYDATGHIAYTVTAESRVAVEALTAITLSNVALLTESDIDSFLSAGMSIAVYDTLNSRVEHVWSRSEDGKASYTKYHYDDLGKLVFTVSAAIRSSVDDLTGITPENAASLSESDIDNLLLSGMSIAVYDTVNNRVDHVWSRSESGEAACTKYFYDDNGTLRFTITGATRTAVESVSGITATNVDQLNATDIDMALGAGMSIAVYDITENRVAYVWARTDNGEISFTRYTYNSDGDLAYTVSGETRESVDGLSGLSISTVRSLSATDIDAILASGMSIAVYDTGNNRVDHVWSKDAEKGLSFSQYHYDALGKLVYTVSGDTRSVVEALSGVDTTTVMTLTESDIDSLLSSGMSIVVYDTVQNRIDHVWSRGDSGDVSFTRYHYDDLGKLTHTVTGKTRSDVSSLDGLTAPFLDGLSEDQIDQYISNGLSVAFYDTVNNRVDHVWSKNNNGDLSYTKYHYNAAGKLVYTVTSASRADVDALSGITVANVQTLSESDIDQYLGAGMNIVVYDPANGRIDHIWARSDSGEASFTQYYYSSTGELAFTISGSNRTQVDSITEITPENIGAVSVATIDSVILAGMSIAVYDMENNRVDHVWSRSSDGDISFTQYNYDSMGKLVFTVSGSSRAQVETLEGVTIDTVAGLTEDDIDTMLLAGMSIAVYDTLNERIDYVWSRTSAGESMFTSYFYDSDGLLTYTISGATRTDVENVSGITLDTIATLTNDIIGAELSNGMSLAVYDVSANRVDYVWSKNKEGSTTFTQYNYDTLGKLVFTASAETRAQVTALTGITVENAATLTEDDIDAYLAAGMSIAVYDTVASRVDHVWSRSSNGEASFTKYYYGMTGSLVYTITGANREEIEALTGITVENVVTLTTAQIETNLGAGMTISVYDSISARVGHTWSRDDNGTITFTSFHYDALGKLVFTLSGQSRLQVEAVSGITVDTVGSLTDATIDTLLGDSMSLAFYDTVYSRVDHVWAKNSIGEMSFTSYNYNADGALVYTLSGDTQSSVAAVSGLMLDTVASLDESDIQNILAQGMSIAVYDIAKNRVDHVWSRSDDGAVSFTEYNYDSLGKLVYTVSGETRSSVESLSGITVANVARLKTILTRFWKQA